MYSSHTSVFHALFLLYLLCYDITWAEPYSRNEQTIYKTTPSKTASMRINSIGKKWSLLEDIFAAWGAMAFRNSFRLILAHKSCLELNMKITHTSKMHCCHMPIFEGGTKYTKSNKTAREDVYRSPGIKENFFVVSGEATCTVLHLLRVLIFWYSRGNWKPRTQVNIAEWTNKANVKAASVTLNAPKFWRRGSRRWGEVTISFYPKTDFLHKSAGNAFSSFHEKLWRLGATKTHGCVYIWCKPSALKGASIHLPQFLLRAHKLHQKRQNSRGRVQQWQPVRWFSRGLGEKDKSSGESRKKGLQTPQPALVREIAFCVRLAKLLCLINRLRSEAASGNRLRHGTGTFLCCWGSISIALEAFTWHRASRCKDTLSGFKWVS